MNDEEQELNDESRDDNAEEAQPPQQHGNPHRFGKGNEYRFGQDGRLTPEEAGRKGGKNSSTTKLLTGYLRKHLKRLVKSDPELAKYHKRFGDLAIADALVHRIVHEAMKDPQKAHPLVRDVFNRIDGMLTPEIEVDTDTPISIVKFVVVDKRVEQEDGDAE